MASDSEALVFAEPRPHPIAIPVVIIIAAAVIAAAGWFTLLPWPPGAVWLGVFVVVAGAVGTFAGFGVGTMGRHREVRIDPRGREVFERVRFLGRERERRWPTSEFQTVLVERRVISSSSSRSHAQSSDRIRTSTVSQMPTERYVISLLGPRERLEVAHREDSGPFFGAPAVIRAESDAGRLAKQCRWQARRRGYLLEVSTEGDHTTSHLTPAPEEESPIELAR